MSEKDDVFSPSQPRPTPESADTGAEPSAADLPCTCHPDDNPPSPCPRKYALSDCRAAASERDPIVEVNLTPIIGSESEWLVEAIDSDGGVHRAVFAGKYAEADARLWADNAYPDTVAEIVGPPTRLWERRRPRANLTIVGGTDT